MKTKHLILLPIVLLLLSPVVAQTEIAIPIEAIKTRTEEIPTQATKPIEIDIRKAEEIKSLPAGCKNLCGDGTCQEIVCLAIGCPCPETKESCPQDCGAIEKTAQPIITLPTEASIKISPVAEKPVLIEDRPVEFKGVEEIPLISIEVKPVLLALPSQVSSLARPEVSVKVDIDEKEKITKLEVGGVVAVTKETLKFENSSLKIETPKKEVFVNIMPNLAEQITLFNEKQKIEKMELKSEEDKAVYEIEGKKEAKLLWIIPVTIPIKTEVNAENGKIEGIEKPWWSFLAI
ncbi:MAG: hypothetical protein QXR09_03845 [Candidatus Aenigmatarchaeota archaeon]